VDYQLVAKGYVADNIESWFVTYLNEAENLILCCQRLDSAYAFCNPLDCDLFLVSW